MLIGTNSPTSGHPLVDTIIWVSVALAAIAGILATLRKVVRWAVHSTRVAFRGAAAVGDVMEVFAPSDGSPGLIHDLAEIKIATRELRPNGGTSMYDRLRVMEVNMSDMKHDYRNVANRSDADKAVIEAKIDLLQHDIKNVRAQMVLTAHLAEKAAQIATGRWQADHPEPAEDLVLPRDEVPPPPV